MSTLRIGSQEYKASSASVAAVDESKTTNGVVFNSDSDGVDEIIIVDAQRKRWIVYGVDLPNAQKGDNVLIDGISGRVERMYKDPTDAQRKKTAGISAGVGAAFIAGAAALGKLSNAQADAQPGRVVRFGDAFSARRVGQGGGGAAFGAVVAGIIAVPALVVAYRSAFSKDDAKEIIGKISKPVTNEMRLSNGLVEQAAAHEFQTAFTSGEQLEKSQPLSAGWSQAELAAYEAAARAQGQTAKADAIRVQALLKQ